MKNMLNYVCVFDFLLALGISTLNGANEAGECPRYTPDMEALKLYPCAAAASGENVAVSGGCCAQVKKMGQNPSCLCAMMLSNTAKSVGVKPKVAITIPKCYNMADRPVGYKSYTLS